MMRACVALSVAALLPGCSLILNFDQAAPADASFDAPYTQAQCDYLEPNDSPATAAVITTAEMGPAAICAPTNGSSPDEDYYKFTVASASVMVAIQFTNRPGGDLDIKLLDSAGTMVSQSRGFGDGETITCPGASPSCPTLMMGSDYILQVFPAVPGSVNSYTFTVMP
jgi:hypothetical protein